MSATPLAYFEPREGRPETHIGSRRLFIAGVASVMLGCAATPPNTDGAAQQVFRGRMGIKVQGQPDNSWSAGFQLTGSADAGQMRLVSPIGTTLALARWAPQEASIERGQTIQRYSDASAMVRELLGADFQMTQLWAWLERKPLRVPGWDLQTTLRPDQSQLLVAHKAQPEPAITLRVILAP